MKQLVRHTIQQYNMVPNGMRILCGLSGGADSVSLLLCLKELGYDVCACHLNHSLRGEQADADEAFCRTLCAAYDIPFAAEKCDVNIAAVQKKLSVETAARELRYDFFTRCAENFHAGRIATAHTADDNLETMLFHLIRGTGAAGLAGIPPVRGNIIRPLIAVERQQVEAYLTSRGQDWRTDATNSDDHYTRNRIRHHVIPALREIEPQAARHAVYTAELLRRDDACLQAMAQVDGTAVSADNLKNMPEAVASRAVHNLMAQACIPMGEVNRQHIHAVKALAYKKRGTVSLPGKCRAVKRGNEICIEKIQGAVAETHIVPEKPVQFGVYTVLVTTKILDIHSSFKHYPISYDTIYSCELFVRAWQPGDRMTLPNARGSRSLKRLYAERGIAADVRDSLPVLCCGEEIAAAAGIGTDNKFYGTSGIFAVWRNGQ